MLTRASYLSKPPSRSLQTNLPALKGRLHCWKQKRGPETCLSIRATSSRGYITPDCRDDSPKPNLFVRDLSIVKEPIAERSVFPQRQAYHARLISSICRHRRLIRRLLDTSEYCSLQQLGTHAVRWLTLAYLARSSSKRGLATRAHGLPFRAHCLGLASGRIPTPVGAPPKHLPPARRLRSPTPDFEIRAHTPARRNPPPDPPKMLLRRLPSARLGLGVATSRSGSPETDGHERKKT